MKRGDAVVIKVDRFNMVKKVTRVLKDGRVQIGKNYWSIDELREPTESELESFKFNERIDRVIDELKSWRFFLTESEVVRLEDIKQGLLRRILDEGINN